MTGDLAALSLRFMEAVRDRELAFLEFHLGNEFTLTTGRAPRPVRTREEWLRLTASTYEIEAFTFDVLETLDYGTAGVVRSRYTQRGSLDGERRDQTYLMTDVWIERDGRPQLVTRHATPVI